LKTHLYQYTLLHTVFRTQSKKLTKKRVKRQSSGEIKDVHSKTASKTSDYDTHTKGFNQMRKKDEARSKGYLVEVESGVW